MMNNQGLEALAALASTVAATTVSNNSDSSVSASASHRHTTTAATGSSMDTAAANAQVTDFTRVMQNAASLLQSTQNVTPQQWQQVLSAATGLVNTSPSFPATVNTTPSGTQAAQLDQSATLALQQQISLYQRLFQNSSQGATPAPPAAQPNVSSVMDAAAAMQLAMRTQGQNQFTPVAAHNTTVTPVVKSQTSTGPASPHAFSQLTAIAPQPISVDKQARDERRLAIGGSDKKLQKRAANRRSAQLSRKRKKAFIEELKEENDDLRRKEQILKSIPDLVVVFDSSGKLWFVSQSVSRFLDFTESELEGTSFWNRLCDDSVRLLKAAFMDSLAARSADSDTAPLGAGFWELRLVDRDGSNKIVTLNGVVHFAGDRPECVCSIRPHEGSKLKNEANVGATTSAGSLYKSLIRVKPQQSVVSNSSSESVTSSRRQQIQGPDAVRISDCGNSSGSSDGGVSDGEINVNTD